MKVYKAGQTYKVQVSLYVRGLGAAAVQIWLQRRILLKIKNYERANFGHYRELGQR